MSVDDNTCVQDNATTNDSDAESEAADLESSYRPISFTSDSDSEPEPEPDVAFQSESASPTLSNGAIPNHLQNPNPNPNLTGISVSSLDLNGRIDNEEEEEAEEVEREASILRAFREDENRRNAPLTAENATRVLDAMRGVSFPGVAPDWAAEDWWVDQLRGLRG